MLGHLYPQCALIDIFAPWDLWLGSWPLNYLVPARFREQYDVIFLGTQV